jgi:hypothetical protein
MALPLRVDRAAPAGRVLQLETAIRAALCRYDHACRLVDEGGDFGPQVAVMCQQLDDMALELRASL